MKNFFIILLSLAGVASAQITWTKVWPPASSGTYNPTNGYEDVVWDAYSRKVWIYSTNGTNSGDQIYSIRLHYFDPAAISDTTVGDNGQTNGGGCFSSNGSWPATHHTVGQLWVDAIRHRLYEAQGVGCTEILLDQWYYQILNPISGNAWKETFPASMVKNFPGEKGPWGLAWENTTLSAGIGSSDTTMSLANTTYAVNQDFYLIDSEVVRVTANGNQYLMGSGPGNGTNPFTITRGQYGTTPATHSAGATVQRLGGSFNNGKVVHDTYHDAFFWFGQRGDNSYGWLGVYCDSSQNPTPGTLTAAQSSVGCTRADDWVDITSKSICADGTACAASAETGTNGPNSGRLPHGWYYPSMDFDPTTNKIIDFAGGIYTVQYQYSFVYDPTTFTWTRLNTTCSGPQCTGLVSLQVTAGGFGYTSAPAVTINGCSGASATANVYNGAVSGLNITNLGTACSSPSVSFSGGGGSGATATAVPNKLNGPPVYSSNSENTRIAHAVFQGKMYYHLSQHSDTNGYSGPVQDWVLDPSARTWTELQTGAGPGFTEAMTVDPATGNLYSWAVSTTGSDAGEIWQGRIGGSTTPTITSISPLPVGTQSSAYSYSFTAIGASPITWSVSSGTLPPGLTLSSGGVLSGTPTSIGAYTFSVQAANAAGTASGTFNVVVAALTLPPSGGTGTSSSNSSGTDTSSSSSGTGTSTAPPTVVGPGLGHSTYNCVDVDGDGYGVGPGCAGADADDNDATVHSASDVLTKYGTLAAFWGHMGWNPTNVLYVDGGSGNCTAVASPFVYDSTKACGTLTAAISAASVGSAVVIRGGTYSAGTTAYNLVTGTQSNGACTGWIYYLAYPGELPDFEFSGGMMNINNPSPATGSCFVVDGIKWNQNSLGTGRGFGAGYTYPMYNWVITHNDISGFTDNIFPQYNQHNDLIEHNYIHGAYEGGDFGHDIYLGSNVADSTGTVIRGNIIADAVDTCIHLNGPMTNITVDSNLVYGCSKGINSQSGISHSTFQNNVVHTNARYLFQFNTYANQYSQYTWQCHDENYNVIRNNTFIEDAQSWNPSGVSTDGGSTAIYVVDDGSCQQQAGHTPDLGHNTYDNNIFVHDCGTACSDYNGPLIRYAGANAAAYLASDAYHSNVLKNFDTSTSIIDPGSGNIQSCSWFTSSANVPGGSNLCDTDPQFVAISPQTSTTGANWNLILQSTSPVLTSGLSSDAPTYDATGALRPPVPGIGAYGASAVGNSIAGGSSASVSACDLNADGVVDSTDVEIALSQALGTSACTNANLTNTGCTVVSVQRIINAALGGACVTGQ